MAGLSSPLPLKPARSRKLCRTLRPSPTTPYTQRRQALTRVRFRLAPVRSPLLGGSRLLSLPRVTKMFQFTRCPSLCLCVQHRMSGVLPRRVSPFGYPRINACLRLPEAYRSLPRPSSALNAKASTVRPYYLDLVLPRCAVFKEHVERQKQVVSQN